MKLKRLFAALLAAGLLLVTASAALAWPGDPFAQVEVSGPGIEGAATVSGDGLGGMTIENFTDFNASIDAPLQLGAAYELHRHLVHDDGQNWDFDRVIYYFDPAGGPGFVFYAQGIGYSPVYNEGKWFRASPQASEMMRALLTQLGAWPAAMAATGGVFAAGEAAASWPAILPLPISLYTLAAVTALAVAGLILFAGLRRRTLSLRH